MAFELAVPTSQCSSANETENASHISVKVNMAEIKFSVRAYAKIILHAAKYPHCAVNGVLLAKTTGSKDTTKPKQLELIDAIPLFHDCLYVTPMAEIALTQIDQWASTGGLVIAGYYIASENIRNNSIERCNHKIADKIAENYSSACLVVVDNLKLSPHHPPAKELPFRVATQLGDNKWRLNEKVSVYPNGATSAVAGMVRYRHTGESELYDFDNHLDDITKDWTNKQLNDYIAEMMKIYIE